MRKKLIELTKQKGMLGYIASLIYFTYASIKSGSDLKSAAMQAYDRQGFDIIRRVDTFEELTSHKQYSQNVTSSDLEHAVNATSDKNQRIKRSIGYLLNTRITTENTTFIDFGCGKGRTLILSHDLGFRYLIGIELSSWIIDVCRKNMDKLNIDCKLINQSMREVNYKAISFPKDNILIYAYNPTSMDILIESINKLLSSQPGKDVFLIYTNPPGQIQNNLINQIKLIKEEHKINIYKCN